MSNDQQTPQGEDLLAWLDRAITAREIAARASETDDPSPWRDASKDEGSASYERPWGTGASLVISASQEPLWDNEGSWTLCMTAATGRFVAANDPESVLRRCAADRKLLELHARVACESFGCDCTSKCRTCDWTESEATGKATAWGEADHHVYPCPTVLALAEGYGWTEAQR